VNQADVGGLSSAAALASADLVFSWPPTASSARLIARLLRLGVETAVDLFWAHMEERPIANHQRGKQIRLLAAVMDRAEVMAVYATWAMLSEAGKPQPYELAPSLAELRALQDRAVRAVEILDLARA
jgi:hypothetical protein